MFNAPLCQLAISGRRPTRIVVWLPHPDVCLTLYLPQTKELLADLQDLLPNTEDAGGANLTMNTVLQCAIDFLTQHAANGDNKESAASEDTNSSGLDIDVAYRSGFMMASMGIAYAGVDGTILEVNPAFASMLGYSADQRHKLIGRTLFSLSTPQGTHSQKYSLL
jgi:PAS domain-containing protein